MLIVPQILDRNLLFRTEPTQSAQEGDGDSFVQQPSPLLLLLLLLLYRNYFSNQHPWRKLDNFICEYFAFFFSISFWPRSMGSSTYAYWKSCSIKMVFARSHTECINAFSPFIQHTSYICATNGHTVKCAHCFDIRMVDRPLYMFIVCVCECRKLLVIAWWRFFYSVHCIRALTLYIYLIITILSRFYLTLAWIICDTIHCFHQTVFYNSYTLRGEHSIVVFDSIWLLFTVCHTAMQYITTLSMIKPNYCGFCIFRSR